MEQTGISNRNTILGREKKLGGSAEGEKKLKNIEEKMLGRLGQDDVSPELKGAIKKWVPNIFMLDRTVINNYEKYMKGNSLWQVWGASGMLQVKVEKATKESRNLNPEEIQEIGEAFAKAADARGKEEEEVYRRQAGELHLLAANVPLLEQLVRLVGNESSNRDPQDPSLHTGK